MRFKPELYLTMLLRLFFLMTMSLFLLYFLTYIIYIYLLLW